MLIITRMKGQRTVITVPPSRDATTVTVGVERGSARLGFDAPPEVVIDREETHQAKVRDYRSAKAVPTSSQTREATEAALKK